MIIRRTLARGPKPRNPFYTAIETTIAAAANNAPPPPPSALPKLTGKNLLIQRPVAPPPTPNPFKVAIEKTLAAAEGDGPLPEQPPKITGKIRVLKLQPLSDIPIKRPLDFSPPNPTGEPRGAPRIRHVGVPSVPVNHLTPIEPHLRDASAPPPPTQHAAPTKPYLIAGHKTTDWENVISPDSPWEVTCGLEVHAQLNTKRKLFSDAKMANTAPPNTYISPIDAALPGVQPTLNPRILLPALRASIALSCTPEPISRFDRKHYFYWDQPAGYQITQFYEPLAKNGRLTLTPDSDGVRAALEVKIKQVQIEQDTGKTIAAPPNSLVDLNRVGAPLVEIITDPFPLDSAETAAKVLAKIQAVLRAVDACVLGMEWGGLRADVNVSVRWRGEPELGQRCEIKNLSSFKAVTEAITAETCRQIRLLEAGGEVAGETRGWDAEHHTTRRLRGKEGEIDYRYMPEPDLPAVVLSEELVDTIKKTMPLLPEQLVAQLTGEAYGLSAKDARTLLQWDDGRSGQPDSVVQLYKDVVGLVQEKLGADAKGVGKAVGNWVVHELGGLLSSRGLAWDKNPIKEDRLADLVGLVLAGKITGPTAKVLLPRLVEEKAMPTEIVEKENLGIREMPVEELEAVVRAVMESEAGAGVVKQLAELPDEKKNEKKRKGLRGFFVGRVLRELGGKVKAEKVDEVLDRLLANAP